ncbi:retrotransposon gag family protein, partial [Haemophilus sp. SZY H54]
MMQNMAQIMQYMQQMAQGAQGAQGGGAAPPPRQDDSLRSFMTTRPPVFHHAIEPMDADDWLETITGKLQLAHVGDLDKALYASHQLQGPAKNWWTAYTAAHADADSITWEEFRRAFRDQYVPFGEIRVKRREFQDLRQGAMTVREYLTRFSQ